MQYYYFIFKGQKSTDFGIEISKLPDIIKPERNIQTVTIPGRNNSLYIDENTYNSYSLNFECVINPFAKNKQNIDSIIEWLNGFGELIISTEKDKIYNAVIKNSIPFSDTIGLFPKFPIIFEVQPLKKSVNFRNETMEITKKTIINNIGTVDSLPTITIFGSGDITLKINDEEFLIKSINQYITIDSEFLEVYKNEENQNNKYNNFDFPKFKQGKNTIDFVGNVNKIIVTPNWRWI
ncbi:MAG: phage tail family protein [Eubacteriales bacterium]|nr:phage tail family protein [Eubacteriales bacterium]